MIGQPIQSSLEIAQPVDTALVATPVVEAMVRDYGGEQATLDQVVADEYETFGRRVAEIAEDGGHTASPVDLLLGAGGVEVTLPSGEVGATPGIQPFADVAAGTDAPYTAGREYALRVLHANLSFFNGVASKTGRPILLRHLNPAFQAFMHQMYGVDLDADMAQVTAWLMDNVDPLRDRTRQIAEFQEQLSLLDLPPNMIFIDLNGTLVPEETVDGYIAPEHIAALQQAVARAKERGYAVGLCSDSPLPQLQAYAETLGIDGPIIAENGNLIFNNGQTLALQTLPEIEVFRRQIVAETTRLGYQQEQDRVAPEFGGGQVDATSQLWSFGANRQTSITVFGPPDLITLLGVRFGGIEGVSVDPAPEYFCLAIHPGEDYRHNKGLTLNTLAAYGYNLVMVGNSKSDWVEPARGVVCTFVAGSRIDTNIASRAGYVSDQPTVRGVIDILNRI